MAPGTTPTLCATGTPSRWHESADHAAPAELQFMSREQGGSRAAAPQSHGQPKKRSSDAAWTGEVAALVHLDVVLVANDILLPQLQCKRTQSTRVNLSPEKKALSKVRVLASC